MAYSQTRSGLEYVNLTMSGMELGEEFNQEGGVCKQIFHVPDWDSRWQFYLDMVGEHYEAGGVITREVPEQHPTFRQYYATKCRLIQSLGVGTEDDAGVLSYDQGCNVEVTFEPLPYAVLSDEDALQSAQGERSRYTEIIGKVVTESFTLPGMTYKWASGVNSGQNIPVPRIKTFFNQEVRVNWHMVPKVPHTFIKDCINKVNSADFTLGENTYATDELMLMNYEYRKILGHPSDRLYWHVAYVFGAKSSDGATWNKLYNPNDAATNNGFSDVTDQNGDPIFAGCDFASLFKQP